MAWLKKMALLVLLAGVTFTASPVTAGEKEPPKDPPKAEGKDPKNMDADECEAAGLCPVTRKPFKPVYHHEIDGKTYHFNTGAAREEFKANPEKFGYKKAAAKKEDKKDDKKKK